MAKKKQETEKVAVKIEKEKTTDVKKDVKHPIINLFLFLALLSSIANFAINCIYNDNKVDSLSIMISSLLLVLFMIFFVSSEITNNKKKKGTVLASCLIFITYNAFSIVNICGLFVIPSVNKVMDFTNKSLVDVIDWASKNNIELIQEYEYSDMVKEYTIISQNITAGTNTKEIKNIRVSISEGPSPYKEVVVPSMVTWDSERVLNFIKKNNLSNVTVEFVESDKVKDTVIEQSNSGSLKRNDEIKLTFSKGEEDDISDTKLKDLGGLSRFEAIFYLKQNSIKYKIEEDFSKKVKKDYVISQSIKKGTIIKKDSEEEISITISKGPKITVPNLEKMSMQEITNFVIKNKLKLEFSEKYDDDVKDNKVISSNYKKGDIIAQGTLISVVISKGKIIMPKFDSLSDFYEWADKYGIKYEEKHEFSDDVKIGEVINYSHKTGDVVKNDDSIIVTISDGKEISIPNLVGKSKSEVISILKKLDLKYNFVYKNSSSVSKDKVISQSISSGAKVGSGTTITVTLSNGKKESSTSSSSSSNSNSSNNNSSSSNDSGSSTQGCEKKTYTIGRDIRNVFNNNSGYSSVSSALYSYFSRNYPNVKFNVLGVDGGDATSGSYIGGIAPGDEVISCNGVTYTIQIAK